MKKTAKIVVCALLIFAAFAVFASAKLTDAQKQSLTAFTENFIENGNSRHLLQYGAWENFKGFQLGLVHVTGIYNDTKKDDPTQIIWMMRPDGYKNINEFNFDFTSRGSYFAEGDYMILDCSAFAALMYKAVFGLRFDYGVAGHISNWTTGHYMLDEYKDLRRVYKYDGSGEEIDLFEVISSIDGANLTLGDYEVDPNELEVGDIIVGRTETGWGHIMIYAGNGEAWHSSSTAYIMENGLPYPSFIRRQPIKTLKNRSYVSVQVLRINDGVLDPDFSGYDKMVDFDALSTQVRAFDTKAPELVSITISDDFVKANTKLITLDITDEFGDEKPVYAVGDGKHVIRGTQNGESGIAGIYMSVSDSLPENAVFETEQATHYEIYRATGVYYLWFCDAAGNLSERYKIKIGKNNAAVYLTSDDGTETEIGKRGKGDSSTEPAKPSEEMPKLNEKPSAVPYIIIGAVAAAIIAVAAAVILAKRRKK